MTDDCTHPTMHGPTTAGTWICNKCGMEIILESTQEQR